ncbi:MAG: DUF882 domain-containing protein [Deltaproteobacteria bacterium]|nr:DUF882 domain-containing protein [Deltaproteobacteria bacterium]
MKFCSAFAFGVLVFGLLSIREAVAEHKTKVHRAPSASRIARPVTSTRRGGYASRPKPRRKWAPVELFHVNRREKMLMRLADDRGRPVRTLPNQASRFLRCHHTNKQHRMDPRLLRLIYETGRHFEGRRIEVISGYRHPTVAKNPKTPHKEGLACDFRVVGIKNAELRDFLRKEFKAVGVGYYPNSGFVHLDVRKEKSAFWIDYSGPKENAIYSEDPNGDLRTGRADGYKPTKVDPAWAGEPKDEEGGPDPESAAAIAPTDP